MAQKAPYKKKQAPQVAQRRPGQYITRSELRNMRTQQGNIRLK
jgi:hypothetical protein